MAKSGITGPEMKCFEPLRIQSSPSRLALVFMDMMSEPASGSVRAKSSRFSPLTQGIKYLSICSPSQAIKISAGRAIQE